MNCPHCSMESEVIFYSEELGYVLVIETEHYSEEHHQFEKIAMEIDYCPFCGRKLKYVNNY